MKSGYSVINQLIFKRDDSILVDNYDESNEVVNLPIKLKSLSLYKDYRSIGIWKIKKN